MSLVTSALRRHAPDVLSPSIKSLNYLNNILARIEANDNGADEALFLDHNGYVAEATVDNFFIVVDRTLMTPPTATNLKGITRETVLELAADLGIRTEERTVHALRRLDVARGVHVRHDGRNRPRRLRRRTRDWHVGHERRTGSDDGAAVGRV